MDNWAHILIVTISTLFPIANPIGNAGIFLSLTAGQDRERKRQLAAWGAIYMFCILEVFFLGGSYILQFFDISMDGMRIAGGILIAKFGFDQLQPSRENTQSDQEHAEARQMDDISFSPLAMPLLAGPGAIASVIGITSIIAPSASGYVWVSIGIAFTCAICWLILRESQLLISYLGLNGANALTKIMGFLLLCIGVQFVVNGVQHIIK